MRLNIESTDANESTNNDSETSASGEDDHTNFSNPSTSKKYKSSKLLNVVTPSLAAALDRIKTSDRNAVYVLAATANSLGHDPQTIVLNRESIRQSRRQHRELISTEIKASFSSDIPLTVH